MLFAKLKYAAVGLLIVVLVSGGGGWLIHRCLIEQFSEQIDAEVEAEESEEKSETPPRFDGQGNQLPPGAAVRLGSVRFRHEGIVGPFALSPDGRTVAAVLRYNGKSVAFWDAATGKLTRRMAFDYPVHYLAFCADGKSLALGSSGDPRHPDAGVRIFDLDTGAEKRSFEGLKRSGYLKTGFGPWGAALFTPDGRTLISHRKDGTVRMWDVQSGKETGHVIGSEWNLWDLSPDGKLLAAAQEKSKNVLRFLDVATGKEVRQLTYSSDISTAAFSPDGKTLAVAFGLPTEKKQPANPEPVRIALWSLTSGKSLGFLAGNRCEVTALAFSPDGKTLATGERYSSLRLWDIGSQKEIQKMDFAFYSILQLAFNRDGKTLVIRGDENRLRLWDVAAGRERFAEEGPGREIISVVFSPDGKLVACASGSGTYAFGGSVWVWKTDTGQLLRKLDSASWSLLFCADGKSLVAANRNSGLTTWDLETGKRKPGVDLRSSVAILRANLGNTVAMSPDGKTFASWYHNPFIEVERAGARKRLPSPMLPADQSRSRPYVTSLCFSLDGRTLYAGGGWKQILRWDMETGNALPHLGEQDGPLCAIALSSDGRSLAAMTLAGSLYLCELASGQARLLVKDAGPANVLAISPDGRFLALANRDDDLLRIAEPLFPRPPAHREQIRLVRIADGKFVRGFSGHLGDIDCLNFSPDGRRLASGGHDAIVLLWEVPAVRQKKATALKSAKLDELWASLNGTAEEAHRSMVTLIAAPSQAVPLLRAKLKPASGDGARIARLLKQLDSDQFDEREEALRKLKKLGEAVEPDLYKALRDKPSLEMRRLLQQILDDLRGGWSITGERLRSLRALEVLERIGDNQAREVLRHLSEGEAGTWFMEEAKTALQRLQHRSLSR